MKKNVLFRLFYWSVILLFMHQNTFSQADSTKKDSVQKSPWTRSGSINVSFTNVQLTNWAAGGQNSIALGGIITGKAIRETKKDKWISEATIQVGGAKVGGDNVLFKKTDDFFILNTQYNRKITEKWAYSGGLDFRTQTLPGFQFYNGADGKERRGKMLSEFFAPAFLTANLGATYQTKIFTATVSPIAGRLTIVQNDSLSNAGAFGVRNGEKTLLEFGPNITAKLDVNLMENINLKSNFSMFSRYDTWVAKGLWDVNWEVLLSLKVNKYFTTSFATHLIYFNNVLILQSDGTSKQAVQFKQVLSVNFGVKF